MAVVSIVSRSAGTWVILCQIFRDCWPASLFSSCFAIHSCEMLEDLCDTCFTESVWWASSFGLFDILWNNFESNNELRLVYGSSLIKANHARQHYQISSLFSLHPFHTSKRTSIIIILFLTKSVYCLCYRRKIVYYNKYLSQDINKVILQLNI